jgi:rhodanese-related sulfurtransferase
MTQALREITAQDVSTWMLADEKFTILDVREPWELGYAHITGERVVNVPMSQIARLLKEAFPPELRDTGREIVVMCHHGVRSANVATWMMQNGWTNISSLQGGIDAYAHEIDPAVGVY